MKILKNFAVVAAVVLATLCMSIFAAACTDDKKDTDTNYYITVVYPDNTPVNGTEDGKGAYDPDTKSMSVQICSVTSSGETITCYSGAQLGADGKATLPAPDYVLQDGEKFKIQVNNIPEGYSCNENRNYVCSTYVTEPGSYTVVLEAETEAE